MASPLLEPLLTSSPAIKSSADLEAFIAKQGTDQIRALTGSDQKRLVQTVQVLRRHSDKVGPVALEMRTENQRAVVATQHGVDALPQGSSLTPMRAYDQVWLPAGNRPQKAQVEVKRY